MKEYLNNNVIQYQKQGNIEYIQFKRLLEFPEITHCYTLRSNEELSFPPIHKDENTLKQSFAKIGRVFNIEPTRILKPHQTHTNQIAIISKYERENQIWIKQQDGTEIEQMSIEEIDGLLTNQKEVALLTTSADCTSLLFYDPIQKIIGSVHSGWKGTVLGISKKTVEKMVEEFSSNPKDIICGICPTIRKCCFEVEEDVKSLFEKEYSNLENIEDIIIKANKVNGKQKYYIDTVEINKQLLQIAGLKSENILDSGICTKCHPEDFHSYRVDKEKSGRNGAMIVKK